MMATADRGAAGERNRYADLLRVLAIAAVVAGHWLLVSITYRDGELAGLDAIRYVSWGGWVTLAFQVMPVFFLVGGYVDAISWTGHHERGEAWAGWVRERATGLLWPSTVYVTAMVLAVAVAQVAGAGPAELAEAGWLIAIQLWFLPVYLLLIALTPVMLAAHRRWGLAVPAVMALGAAAVDIGVVGAHLPLIGYAELPAGMGLDVPVGVRLAGRHPDPAPVAPIRVGRRWRRGPGWPRGLGPLPRST